MDQSKKKYGLKARCFDKGGETKQVIKANDHNKMNEVANLGRNKGGIMDLGGGQVNIG